MQRGPERSVGDPVVEEREDRVDHPFLVAEEERVVLPRELHVRRIGDVGGQVPPVLDGRAEVFRVVDHERRGRQVGKEFADVVAGGPSHRRGRHSR